MNPQLTGGGGRTPREFAQVGRIHHEICIQRVDGLDIAVYRQGADQAVASERFAAGGKPPGRHPRTPTQGTKLVLIQIATGSGQRRAPVDSARVTGSRLAPEDGQFRVSGFPGTGILPERLRRPGARARRVGRSKASTVLTRERKQRNPGQEDNRMHGVTLEEVRRLVAVIDYSEVLTITASEEEVRAACRAARNYRFRAVVAFPQHLGILVDELKDSGVRAQIPISFPCGGTTTYVKCREAEEGLRRGATDMDMVMNIAAFKAGDYARVARDICEVMAVARPYQIPFKVIIEIGVLSEPEKVTAAKLVLDSGADFIKTCTGFGPGRATVHDIGLIRETVGDRIGIKASGGVASIEDGVALMRAGATVVAMRRFLIEQLEAMNWQP